MIGQILDSKYRIESQLGKGGMGTVYLATHIGTERPVAVKVIASEFMQRAEFVERFRREARAAGRLRHPNVVDVTDFGFAGTKTGDVAYLVMEYLDGCTLGEILEEEKQLPLQWTIDILEQVCSAVQEAHQQGIIHRDLKPDNIWLEPNQRGGFTVKVLDFGIAKLEETHLITADDSQEISQTVASTQIFEQKSTISDTNQTQTIADEQSSTRISESETLALTDSAKNVGSEAGTIIQSTEADLESGTAIFPSDQMQATTADDKNATKLNSDQIETDEEPEKISTGARSLTSNPSISNLTRVGAVLGTPLYMSPEQCRGENLSIKSDIYSLGIIVYQMLSGRTPFDGDYKKVMEAHKETEPPQLEAKKVSKKVREIVHASLHKMPENRPQTAEAFASKLRSESEGLGTLLRRALVLYSEGLPKFLLISLLLGIPSVFLTLVSIGLRFLLAFEVVSNSYFVGFISGSISLTIFFVQIFYSALLVGMTTWIIAQALATPLRPISIRATFRKAKERWKPLLGTVTLSTLLAILSIVGGLCIGVIVSLIIGLPIYYFTDNKIIPIIIGSVFGLAGLLIIGVGVTALVSLVAPSVMMESVRGIAAFKRSIELVRRAFGTVFATSLLVYIVPVALTIIVGLTINGMMKNFEKTENSVKPPVAEQTSEKKNDVYVQFNEDGFAIGDSTEKGDSDEKSMADKIRSTVKQGLFELIQLPIIILLSSFTSVITALLYFKTRQAGGETMVELLEQFEETEQPKSGWQKRVQKRVLQSGKLTSNKKVSSGN